MNPQSKEEIREEYKMKYIKFWKIMKILLIAIVLNFILLFFAPGKYLVVTFSIAAVLFVSFVGVIIWAFVKKVFVCPFCGGFLGNRIDKKCYHCGEEIL